MFFDELGPPWPKHPCTTRNRAPLPQYKSAAHRPETHKIASGNIGIDSLFMHDFTPDLYRVTFQCEDTTIPSALFFPKRSLSGNLSEAVLAFLRPLNDHMFTIEYLGRDARTYSITVYTTRIGARKARYKVKRVTVSKGALATAHAKPPTKRNQKRIEKKHTSDSLRNLAMEEAFKRAKGAAK